MTDIVKKVYDTVDDNHRVFLVVASVFVDGAVLLWLGYS